MPAPYFGFVYLRYLPMIYELLLQKSVARVNESLYKMLTLRYFVTDYNLFFRVNYNKIKEILLRPNTAFFNYVEKDKIEKLIHHININPKYKLLTLSELITLKLFFDTVY